MTESTDVNLRLAQAIEWDMNVRDWEHSFDACLRDIVPVLRARGLTFTVVASHVDAYAVTIYKWPSIEVAAAVGPSLPAVFCEAALVALVARESPEQAGLIFP